MQALMRVVVVVATLAVVLAAAGCSGTATETTASSTVVDQSSGSNVDKLSILAEYVARRSDGRVIESLELAAPDVADLYQQRIGGLAAWNFRSEQVGSCTESPAGTYSCEMLEYTDFHASSGLSPWTDQMTVTIGDDGVITDISHRIVGFGSGVDLFNKSLSTWLATAHPEAAERMNGEVMTLSFTADNALIALEFVQEFVAQSDRYPVGS
jgi:hypothetical protein